MTAPKNAPGGAPRRSMPPAPSGIVTFLGSPAGVFVVVGLAVVVVAALVLLSGVLAPTTPVAFDPEAWLQSLDKLDFVLRSNPGKDIGTQGRILQLLFGKTVEVPARHGALLLRQQTELATYCLSGHRMIAGYHFDRNSGAMADTDGVHRLGSGWVDHAEQTCKLQITADRLRWDLVL